MVLSCTAKRNCPILQLEFDQMPMCNEDHVTLAVFAIGYILFSPLTPATHFPALACFLFTPGFN